MDNPNILFLLSDEHSFRHLSVRDSEEEGEPVCTENLDELAKNGVSFDKAYTQMPLCTPSRMGLLTGKEVRKCGGWKNSSAMRKDERTIAHEFKDEGYETCLVGKMHFGGDRQFNGFEHRPYGDLTGGLGHQWEPILPEGGYIKGMRERTSTAGLTTIPESLMQEQISIRESIGFLREHQSKQPSKPWFLTVSFARPHFPLNAPERHFNNYWPDNITEPKIEQKGDTADHPLINGMVEGFRTEEIGDEEKMKARAAYFANVDYLDELIGDLLLQLENSGLLDNTIVVYTSDHGELAGEHGLWWKHSWHEAATRVPLIVQTPAHRAGEQPPAWIDTPVSLRDIYPTLTSLAGITPEKSLSGQDLGPTINEGAEPSSEPVYCDNLVPRWGEGTEFRMIREGKYKFVGFRGAPNLLFDLEEDPLEQENIINSSDTEVKEMKRYFEELLDDTMDFEAAEEERKEDSERKKEMELDLPESTGNVFLMPDGRLVNGDDIIYSPTVLSENPEDLFEDWPEKEED